MTVVVPLSAFVTFISELFFSSVIAFLSFSGRLSIALVIGVCASCLSLYVCMCASVSFNSFIVCIFKVVQHCIYFFKTFL